LGNPLKVWRSMSSTHPWRRGGRDNVSFIGEASQKFDPKNMILTYTKDFP